MSNEIPIFKSWVPDWMIKWAILLMMFPSVSLFGFFTTNTSGTAGYYGIEPQDVQFSVVLFYASLASFYPLEKRFFRYLASRNYFIIGVLLLIATSAGCYYARSGTAFFILRFLQGVFNGGVNTICITLLFSRFSSERSRVIGYSYFYGLLLCSSPLTMLITSRVLDHYDLAALYKLMIFMLVPPAILLTLMMNDIRLRKKFPLYQLDWKSYVLYLLVFCSAGYALIYGQTLNWLEDWRIRAAIIVFVVVLCLFFLRQKGLKRQFIEIGVFRYKNYVLGACLLIPLYVCRGSLSISTNYFSAVLRTDPIHISNLMLANLAGIIVATAVVARAVLLGKPIRQIFLVGFAFMFIFHLWMSFLFTSTTDDSQYILPLLIQGLGSGTLLVPLVIFVVSSVPAASSISASGAGIFFRFIGFCLSLSLINFFQLSDKSRHYQSFRQEVTATNPLSIEKLQHYEQMVHSKGLAADEASRAAQVLLNRSVDTQTQLLYAIDYYRMLCFLIAIIMVIIALSPYINRTVVRLKGAQPAPASY
ncbi:MFS transporter [Arcticibacter sp. MXS-1]|uniref:MFS transporter n=1 Tax=Arcticibacter sp. MXS-1 TaxID=3341726 RepID=UPI0035A8886F